MFETTHVPEEDDTIDVFSYQFIGWKEELEASYDEDYKFSKLLHFNRSAFVIFISDYLMFLEHSEEFTDF